MLVQNDSLNDCFKFCKNLSDINDFTLTNLWRGVLNLGHSVYSSNYNLIYCWHFSKCCCLPRNDFFMPVDVICDKFFTTVTSSGERKLFWGRQQQLPKCDIYTAVIISTYCVANTYRRSLENNDILLRFS